MRVKLKFDPELHRISNGIEAKYLRYARYIELYPEKKYTVFFILYHKEYMIKESQLHLVDGYFKYLIVEDNIPYCFPVQLFEVKDTRASRYWKSLPDGQRVIQGFDEKEKFRTYPTEDIFLDHAVWNDKQSMYFYKYYPKMRYEFPDKALPTAADLGDRWVLCGHCSNAWQPHPLPPYETIEDGIIECPQCNAESNNPYYAEHAALANSQNTLNVSR